MWAFFLYNSGLGIFLTYGLFFQRVSNDFGQPALSTVLVFSTFAAVYSISAVAMGFFMDKYGARRTILLGGTLMAVGLVLSSQVGSIQQLMVTYGVLAGAGSGSMWLPTSYIVLGSFGPGEVKRATGMVSAGTAFGTLIFSPLEGVVISLAGWRDAFVVVGVVSFALAILAWVAASGVDRAGGFSLRGTARKVYSRRFSTMYVYYMFGNAFSRSLAMVFVAPLLEGRGLGIAGGSMALALIGLGSVFGRLTTREKRLGEEAMAALGFVLQGGCILGLLYSYTIFEVAFFSLLFGLGYGVYIPQFVLMIRKYWGVENYGAVFGVLLTSFGVGGAAGPIFEGFEVSLLGSYTVGFLLAGAMSTVVGLHFLLAGRLPHKYPRHGTVEEGS
ncbi:MAG: MFS transporter [Nitrososphaerota archaeon]|nr:MFS transporter [Nitrososphaerota archaeon]